MKKRTVMIILLLLIFAGSAVMAALRLYGSRASVPPQDEVLTALEAWLPPRRKGVPEERGSSAMPVFACGGTDYAALLECGTGIRLPVLAEWNEGSLKQSPCRRGGNPYDGSLVIGGSGKDFRFLAECDVGTELSVTDMSGLEFVYAVERVSRTKQLSDETLFSGDYDLTLFIGEKTEGKYILVRCRLKP